MEDLHMATPTTKTVHAPSCARVFARYDSACPRCQELIAGQAPRVGWGDRKREQLAQDLRAISAHFAVGGPHDRGLCGPVCTAFDW